MGATAFILPGTKKNTGMQKLRSLNSLSAILGLFLRLTGVCGSDFEGPLGRPVTFPVAGRRTRLFPQQLSRALPAQ